MSNEETILQNALAQLRNQKATAKVRALNARKQELQNGLDAQIKAKEQECADAIKMLQDTCRDAIVEIKAKQNIDEPALKEEIDKEVDEKYLAMETNLLNAIESAKA